jgi:hypothetical protein
MAGEQSGYGFFRCSAIELPGFASRAGLEPATCGLGEVSVAYATGLVAACVRVQLALAAPGNRRREFGHLLRGAL